MTLKERLRSCGRTGELIAAYGQIIIGCVMGGLAYPMFLTPNAIAPGGATGIATILYHLIRTPVGTVSLLMNVPLFIIGYRSMGKVFVVRSFIATVLFSLCIDLLQVPPVTVDPLLGAIYGGVLLGVGLGLILRGGATTGGSDMAGRMIHAKVPYISVGMLLFFIDFVVVLTAGIILGADKALYALISIFVSSKAVDMVLEGFGTAKACFIITPAWEKVSQRIMGELNRGCTILSARGAYSGQDRPMVMCVVSMQELARLKEVVQEEDHSAFMIVCQAHEALGEGFANLAGEENWGKPKGKMKERIAADK